MFTPVLAFSLSEFAGKFGLHTEAFIAHFIAFTVLVAVVVIFGIKPIMQQLEERRQRIEEGEAMHEQSQKELAEVKLTSEKMLDEARETGREEITRAKETAARLQEDLSEKAAAEARNVIENAHKQAELDRQREQDALKADFARLVAEATAQVTGKVLTEADHRTINAEAISRL